MMRRFLTLNVFVAGFFEISLPDQLPGTCFKHLLVHAVQAAEQLDILHPGEKFVYCYLLRADTDQTLCPGSLLPDIKAADFCCARGRFQ